MFIVFTEISDIFSLRLRFDPHILLEDLRVQSIFLHPAESPIILMLIYLALYSCLFPSSGRTTTNQLLEVRRSFFLKCENLFGRETA